MTMLGYQNNVLRIDLTAKKASTEPLRMDFAEKYIGSKGLAIRYMYEELKPGIDALGPENKMFLTKGPMTGTPVPVSYTHLRTAVFWTRFFLYSRKKRATALT